MTTATLEPQGRLACPHVEMKDGRPSLLGSRCTKCSEVYFPPASGCTRCLSTALESFDIGSEGILWSWTIQGFLPKPPYNSGENDVSFKPYGVGYVQMPSGIKIESRLTVADGAQLRIGMPMRLTLACYGATAEGMPLYTFVFEPQSQERKNHA